MDLSLTQDRALPFLRLSGKWKWVQDLTIFCLICKVNSYHTLPDSRRIGCALTVAPVKALEQLRNQQCSNRERNSAEYSSNVPYPSGAFHPERPRRFAYTPSLFLSGMDDYEHFVGGEPEEGWARNSPNKKDHRQEIH